jgi:RNA polymerase sigma-70 factor (ECF subfamily)
MGPSSSRTSPSLLGRLRLAPDDPAAWDEFVKRYGLKIYQWCCRWGLQHADAEDVTQNVLLEIARKMRTFTYDPARSFRGWLRVLTHAAWCDLLESRKRRPAGSGDRRVQELLETVEARDQLVQRLEEQYDSELLAEAEARVRLRVEPHTWEAFRLLAVEGRSGAEAAGLLGMTVGTVFKCKSRVQKMLRDEVAKLDRDEVPSA